jgi:membrane protease YdiL (CAAX protease family)
MAWFNIFINLLGLLKTAIILQFYLRCFGTKIPFVQIGTKEITLQICWLFRINDPTSDFRRSQMPMVWLSAMTCLIAIITSSRHGRA